MTVVPTALDDLLDLPPFEGFPPAGMSFLRKLTRNNNRPWFTEHKHEYEEQVRLPMQSLVAALHPAFERFAPEFDPNPRRSIFRIYRDTRFSADKTPYKTHVAAHIVLRGSQKGFVGSGYYLHIEPTECYIGAGIYMPDADQLKAIRKALEKRPEDFLSIINDKTFVRAFGKLTGDSLKRMPKGFSDPHPMGDWIKLKQFFVGVSMPPKTSETRSFVRVVSDVCERATPLVRFLNQAMRERVVTRK